VDKRTACVRARHLANSATRAARVRAAGVRAAVDHQLRHLRLGRRKQLQQQRADRARRARLAVREPVGPVAAAPRRQAQPPALRVHVGRRQRRRRATQPPARPPAARTESVRRLCSSSGAHAARKPLTAARRSFCWTSARGLSIAALAGMWGEEHSTHMRSTRGGEPLLYLAPP